MLFRLLVVFCVFSAAAAELRYDCAQFVKEGLQHDRRLEESRFSTDAKKNKISALRGFRRALEIRGVHDGGARPGLKETVDDWGDTVDTWDFTRMGPFFGTEVKAIQPLNYGQYLVGKKAAEADLRQQEMKVAGDEHDKAVELQSYYYNYLYVNEMLKLARETRKQMDRAYEKLENALDEDDPKVSQMDLLQLKANMHTVDEGLIDAQSGLDQLNLAARFVLNLDDSTTFVPADTILALRSEFIPDIEEARRITVQHHPELKRLAAGLSARTFQMELAQAKLGPQFFVMGEFTYVKSWAGNRQAIQKDAFAQDAVNKISGTFGLGMTYKLNFWDNWESYKAARSEYRGLKLKENYAADGICMQMEEQHIKVMAQKAKVESLRSSLRASDAILKGAAMKYDLDPTQTGALVSAYKDNVGLQKDYYSAVCKYNIAVAELISRMGLSLSEYQTLYQGEGK